MVTNTNKCVVSFALLVLLIGFGGICVAGTNSDPSVYPSYYPTDTPSDYPTYYPTDYPTITIGPTDYPTPYPTYTVEPTQIGGDSGWVSIDSNPQGATVYFDGSNEGTTPVSVQVMSTATPSHSIRITKNGYQDWSSQLSRNPGSGETIYQYANLVEIQPTITVEPTIIGNDYGWFKIDSYPQGADVYFDSSIQGSSPVLVKVMSTATPSHDIRISKYGYRDYTQHLSVNPGPDQTYPIYAQLIPLAQYGSIYVTSSPSGALATLDSGQQYLTPCTFTSVFPGTHTLTVSKSGYNSNTQQVVTGLPGQSTQSVYVPLTIIQTTGTLYVNSQPQGADVKVDNSWQGQTPQRVGNLASGYHSVKLQLSGYQTITQQVMITAGQETQISPVLVKEPPEVKTGSISVSSNPPGASVSLNNDFQGITPQTGYLDLTDLTPGVYTILLKEPQHEDYSSSITVTAGQTTPVNVELKAPVTPAAINGTLSVSSSPSGAQVFLDNRLVGVTPVSISTVVPGQYGLLLKMNGYTDYMNQVQIAAGMSTSASINLTPLPPVSQTGTPVTTSSPVPTQTRSSLPVLLVPAGLLGALLLIRRNR